MGVASFGRVDYRRRFGALDGLRGLAVGMVFLEHYGGGAHGGRVLNFVNAVRLRGWMGVDLFFVLSGFLITGILYDTLGDSGYFSKFFARRGLRILPVMALVAGVLGMLTPFVGYAWRWGHLGFLFYVGNLLGNWEPSLYGVVARRVPAAAVTLSHLWSLCVEEQFYLLWPLVVFAVRRRERLLAVALGLCGLALGLRVWCYFALGPVRAENWIGRTLPFRMDALLVGGVLAMLLRGPRADAWQRACGWVFAAAGGVVLAGFVVAPAYDAGWLLTWGLTLVALAVAGLIGATLREGTAAYRIFSWRPLLMLGRISYGFYVYHLLFRAGWIEFLIWVTARLHSRALGGAVALTVNFAVTFAVAWLSYELWERWFLRRKRRWAYDADFGNV